MLTVYIPESARKEREYVLDVLLRRWLGLDYRLEIQPGLTEGMVLTGPQGSLAQPDLFLSAADADWCGEATCPEARQVEFRSDLPGEWAERIGENNVAVIFGHDREPLVSRRTLPDDTVKIRLGVDLIGTAFFFLSRYEEVSSGAERDEHDRFPAGSSLAGRAGLLQRPVVNEYLELLWLMVREVDPGLRRKERAFEVAPTHDVDRPFRYRGVGAGKFAKNSYFRLRRGESPGRVFHSGLCWIKSRFAGAREDPYFSFPWILDVSEPLGLQNTFYIQCTNSHHKQDDNFNHLDRGLAAVLREAVQRGHRVGIHPGYGTYQSGDTLRDEITRFRELWRTFDCGEPHELRSRQHYLRWDQAVTPALLEEAGVTHDSTLGFADTPGFRSGCCYEYPLFDLKHRRVLSVIEDPLVLMECSIIDDRYLGLGCGDSGQALARQVWGKCRRFHGRFVFLWHNHRFVDEDEKEFYEAILAMNDRGEPSK